MRNRTPAVARRRMGRARAAYQACSDLGPLWVACFLSLSACATITAPDEADSLSKSADAFGTALKAADDAQKEALRASERESYRTDVVLLGGPVDIPLTCVGDAERANDALDQSLIASPYDSSTSDAAYRKLQQVAPCDVPGSTQARTLGKALDKRELDLSGGMGAGGVSLPQAARQLSRYTDALADLATNKTGAATDAERSKLITAGQGLLGALGVGGPLQQIAAVANAAISSIVAAKRNEAMRKSLNAMDPAMPALMERLGLAARVAHSQAALNSARAARSIARWMNTTLNDEAYIQRTGGARRGTAERARLYDEAETRLDAYDALFSAVTEEDPMKAAVAYAAAHHELTKVYNDPRASRRSLAEALGTLQEAASALSDAIKKAKAEKKGAAQ